MSIYKIDYDETLSQYKLYSVSGGYKYEVSSFGSSNISHCILHTSLEQNTIKLRFNQLSDLILALNNVAEAYKLVAFFYGGAVVNVDFNIKSTKTLSQVVSKYALNFTTQLAGNSEEGFDISYSNYFMSKKSVAYNEYYSNHNKIFEPIFNLIKSKVSLADNFQKSEKISLAYEPKKLLINNLTAQVPRSFSGGEYTGDVHFNESVIDLNSEADSPVILGIFKLLYIKPEYNGLDYTLRFTVLYKNKVSKVDIKVVDKSLLKLPCLIDKLIRVDLIYETPGTQVPATHVRVGDHVFCNSFLANPHYNKLEKNLYTIVHEDSFLKILDYNYNSVATFTIEGLPTIDITPDIFLIDGDSNIYANISNTLYVSKLNKPLSHYKTSYTTNSEDVIDVSTVGGLEYVVTIDLKTYASKYVEQEYILKIGDSYYNNVTDQLQENSVVNRLTSSALTRLEFEITSSKEPVQILLTNGDKSVVKEAYVETPALLFRRIRTSSIYCGYAEDKFIFRSPGDGWPSYIMAEQAYTEYSTLINNEPMSIK